MDKETIKDIKTFYKTVGALDELSERNLLSDEDNGEHEKYLKELLNKYDVEYENKKVNTLMEQSEYNIELELLIDEKFTDMLCE